MKKLTKVLCAVAVTCLMSGFAAKLDNGYVMEQKRFTEVFHQGETVNQILKQYHNEANEGVDFEEWKFNILHLPENKHLLNQHGGLKLVQVGEKIHIVCNVRVAK